MKRTREVRPRLTEAELAAWEAARTQTGGRELAAWVRVTVNAAIGYQPTPEEAAHDEARAARDPVPGRIRPVPVDEREIAVDEVSYRALIRAGNNLNQLARWANTEQRFPVEAEAREVFEDVRLAVAEVRAAIRIAEARARRGRS